MLGLITSAVENTEEHNVVTACVFLVQHGFDASIKMCVFVNIFLLIKSVYFHASKKKKKKSGPKINKGLKF